MRKPIAMSFLFVCLFKILSAQAVHDSPEIGKPCPDFLLNEVYQFRSSKASLKDFKGKPLIIDFFEKYCVVCFKGFPKINHLQTEFKDSVQFLLVGYDESNIRQVYNRFQKHFDIHLPVAYDSLLPNQFQIVQFPYVVWVDAEGIVKAVTLSDEITAENLRKLINKQPINLPLAKNRKQFDEELFYDRSKPLLANVNSANDSSYLYRSILMKWIRDQRFDFDASLGANNIKTVQGTGYPLFCLYKEAYGDTVIFDYPPFPGDSSTNHYGNWYLLPITEQISDSSFQYDLSTGKNLYSYYLSIPAATSIIEMQWKMRNDLKGYFGYEVTVEKRSMPYWRLTATEEARHNLVAKGGKYLFETDFSHFKIINGTVGAIIRLLWVFNQDDIFIDETGINTNIDFQLDAIFTDFENIRNQLKLQGLDLIKGTKEMNTIVFRKPHGKGRE